MFDKIFTYQEGEFYINKKDILFHPTFKEILKRNKGITGDLDGRRKLLNLEELKYIWVVADYDSYPNRHGFSDAEAREYAESIAKLHTDWKPDDVVNDAIEVYRDYQADVTKDEIKELLMTFRNNTRIIKIIRLNIKTKLTAPILTPADIKDLLDYQKTLLSIAGDVPKQVALLHIALDNITKSKVDPYNKMRGSEEEAPDSANPDTDLSMTILQGHVI